jgi:hypothetical protein
MVADVPRALRTRRLAWVTLVWLACQTASLAAVPFASCHGHDHALATHDHGRTADEHSGHSLDDCPMHHRHGAAVPAHEAHHASGPSDGPSMRCQCRISDDALAALVIGTGLLSPSFALPYDPIATATPLSASDASPRSSLPDTPPPRL